MTDDIVEALVRSIDPVLIDSRIHRVLNTLEARPEYANAVARSRATLTEFLRSWCDLAVPAREQLTEWALDWIERRNDLPTEGAMDR